MLELLLATSNADVLIWGIVLRQGGKSLPKIYWTTSRDSGPAHAVSRYQMTDDFSLPAIFWQDLTDVLALLVATSEADIGTRDGRYRADTLAPFIQRVRALLRSSKAEQWNAATRAKLLTILGNALTTYSDQSGLNEPLLDAIAAHQEALAVRPRDGAPLDWAASQNYLGNALVTLGQRETRPARLNAAVEAYRNALQERHARRGRSTGQRPRTIWAMRCACSGSASPIRPASTMPSPRSAPHCRNARASAYRSNGPLVRTTWVSRCGFSVNATSDAMLLDEAIAACRAALQERTREKVPLYWATTENNLGNALRSLGQQRSDAALLNEALAAYRAALEERTRSKMPLEWATTKNNLGLALAALGQQESHPARLIEAVAAYREALLERTREKAPLDWALTQSNLGNALRILGRREPGTARLDDAKRAHDLALAVFREAGADYYVQFAERNLQRVRADIAQRTAKNHDRNAR